MEHMRLDGLSPNYFCAKCGEVSGMMGHKDCKPNPDLVEKKTLLNLIPRKTDKREEFAKELHELLVKYECEINAIDHWQGYPECGADIRMTVEFDDYKIKDIDLGTWLDPKHNINV